MKNLKESTKTEYTKRINIIKGQLDGLLKMIEEDQYCINILDQSLAIQNSLRSLDALIFERHLQKHVANQFKKEEERAIKELSKLFKKVNR